MTDILFVVGLFCGISTILFGVGFLFFVVMVDYKNRMARKQQ